jgi:3-methyladenine DNA glycosylase/8-oxoguanine DNA glycosylase
MSEALERTLRPRRPLDLRLTLGLAARPRTTLVAPGEVWRATRTPDGEATILVRTVGADGRLVARAWGRGAPWALEHLPDLVGENDDVESFDPGPRSGLVAALWARFGGMRVPRTRAVAEFLVPVVLEQKVIGKEARRSYGALVRRFGTPAPGPVGVVPVGLRVPPPAAVLAALPAYGYHRFGVEEKRAGTVRRVTAVAARVDAVVGVPLPEAHRRLQAIPGVGAWTSAEVALVALGDADAVSVGDYHLPNLVSWALAGEPRGDDDRMLELLEPWRGHRGRVVRLLEKGVRHAPRYGPRLSLREITSQ